MDQSHFTALKTDGNMVGITDSLLAISLGDSLLFGLSSAGLGF
jgi:hypothetical protein